jgi:hypothetical protein
MVRFRKAKLLPIAVATVDAALALLRQFSVAAVFVPVPDDRHWAPDTRLLTTDAPVVLLAAELSNDALTRLLTLSSGFAAIVIEPYTDAHVRHVLQQLGLGERGIVCPETVGGRIVSG